MGAKYIMPRSMPLHTAFPVTLLPASGGMVECTGRALPAQGGLAVVEISDGVVAGNGAIAKRPRNQVMCGPQARIPEDVQEILRRVGDDAFAAEYCATSRSTIRRVRERQSPTTSAALIAKIRELGAALESDSGNGQQLPLAGGEETGHA